MLLHIDHINKDQQKPWSSRELSSLKTSMKNQLGNHRLRVCKCTLAYVDKLYVESTEALYTYLIRLPHPIQAAELTLSQDHIEVGSHSPDLPTQRYQNILNLKG